MVNTSDPSGRKIRKMVYASLFASMTAVGAYIFIPVGPVPVTVQVLFVFLTGAFLGARWGMVSMLVYLLLGIAGLPVFSGGGAGFGMLLGPTGGYLPGFVAAAGVIGYLTERLPKRSFLPVIGIFLAGMTVIYLAGFLQLVLVASLGPKEAFLLGVAPFILFDAGKALLAAVIFVEADVRL
jgi:biotin transport system substrate-specific component